MSEPLTDAEWRTFQEIPEQGYSHRAWVDARIAERQDALAERIAVALEERARGFASGWGDLIPAHTAVRIARSFKGGDTDD